MDKKTIGMITFISGFVIIFLYLFYKGFETFKQTDMVILMGIGISIVGFLLIFTTIFFEQKENKQKMNEKINKEDLEP